jgi:integrase/recombinase XerC
MNELQLFIDYLKHERRYSGHTTEAYERDLQQFFDYVKKEYEATDLSAINHKIIRAWLAELMEKTYDARSVNRKISSLKSFYKYMLRLNKVNVNPMLKIVSPKTAKKLPVYVQSEKLNQLLDQTPTDTDFKTFRDDLIIELFYTTGMRLAELLGLTIHSISSNQKQIKVLGKRNKERMIPLLDEVYFRMKNYLQLRSKIETSTDQFFIDEKGKALNRTYIYRLVKEKLSLVSTQKKRSPHVLRHSFATEMLNNGAELNGIKEILGHANLQATQVYTHNTIEKLKKAYQKAHPRA